MSEPIKVGDLVMYVRAHCPRSSSLGRVFTATGAAHAAYRCHECGGRVEAQPGFLLDMIYGAPAAWLKRIPPLSELEGQRTEETLKVVA